MSVCVLVCFSLCVVIIVFFLIVSSLVARVFNKLTRYSDAQGTKCRRNIAENLNVLSGVHERFRHDRQTDGRATSNTVERSRMIRT